jgi:hypothetical protein
MHGRIHLIKHFEKLPGPQERKIADAERDTKKTFIEN